MESKSFAEGTEKMFRLLRYFSLASAGVIVVVISLLMVFFHHLSVEDLVNVGQRQNEILARAIGNHIWNRFGPYLSSIKEADGETILSRARTREISEELSPQIVGLPVSKVEILNLNGFIIYSTEEDEVGQNRSNETGFLAGRQGTAASELTLSSSTENAAQAAGEREMLSSYIPFHDADGTVVGVFEFYSDVTMLLADIDEHVLHVFVALLAGLGLLYVVLYQVVRRADKIIKTSTSNCSQMKLGCARAVDGWLRLRGLRISGAGKSIHVREKRFGRMSAIEYSVTNRTR